MSETSISEVGTLLEGRYEVVEALGSGASGTVVRVIDRSFNNTEVVLKLLHSHLLQESRFTERFQREVLLMRQLTHPHIVRTYDFGQFSDGGCYISMEHVDGFTLEDKVTQLLPKVVGVRKSLELLAMFAEGMQHAHEKGVVHRDLKPENIFLTLEGVLKVGDFGLALPMLPPGSETAGTSVEESSTVGTPSYMSPEQLRGEDADPRSDIYAFGIIAFELLCGQRPYDAESFLELAHMHFHEPLPVHMLAEHDVPEWLQDLVIKCTEKNPANRFQSFAELHAIIAPQVGSRYLPLDEDATSIEKLEHLIVSKAKTLLMVLLTVAALTLLFWNPERRVDFLRLLETPVPVVDSHLDLSWLKQSPVAMGFDVNPSAQRVLLAVANGDVAMLRLLLKAGVSPKIRSEDGSSPLHLAATQGNRETLELLLKYGADPSAVDAHQRLPVTAAIIEGHEVIANILLAKMAEVSSGQALFNLGDVDGKTALVHAIEKEQLSVVQNLIAQRASLMSRHKRDLTPLMLAVETGNLSLVKAILRRGGATIDLQDLSGRTALMQAADFGYLEIAKHLLSCGADLYLSDREQKTAIDYARESENPALFKYFTSLLHPEAA